MNTYIALLRGINVSGHKKVPMAELRELLKISGLEAVQTYIQSGNVVFESSEKNIKVLEAKIHNVIKAHFTFDVPVIVRTHVQLQTIFDACPFSQDKKENSYFVLLNKIPDSELVEKVKDISYENEEFQIINDCLYFHSSAGYGKSKFNMNMFEKKLKVNATTRNYKTMVKLLSLSQ